MATPALRILRKTILLPSTFPTRTIVPCLFSSLCHLAHPPPQHPPETPPPVAKKVPFTVSAHGVSWEDPYHWMSNTHDPDILNYLHLENAYSQAFMADTHKLQQELFSEMISRLPPQISTAPERWGPWLYYQYIPEGKEYPVLCRKVAVKNTSWVKNLVKYVTSRFVNEEILLDWNEIAKEFGYVHVGTCRVSPDHHFLAYTFDMTGGEQFVLQVKDLRLGSIIPTIRVEDVVSLAWAQDGCTLFYTLCDESQRPYRVQYTTMGSDSMNDVVVYTENDNSFCVDITSTKDGKFVTVNSNSRTSSEVYVIDANNPKEGLRKLRNRVPGVQYFLEHHRGFFYILTNAPSCNGLELAKGNYYLTRCCVEDVQLTSWQKIIVPSEDTSIQDMDIFNEHLVLFLNKKDAPMICSIDMPIASKPEEEMEIDDLDPWYFPMPSNSCSVVPGSNHDFTNSLYRVVLSSPVMPDLIVDYDMSRRTFSLVQQDEVLGISAKAGSRSRTSERETSYFSHTEADKVEHEHRDEMQGWMNISDAYFCDKKDVVSHDGTVIPLTILYSRKAHEKGQSPGILHGYGSYGQDLDKSWSAERLSLLDRGWVVAFADVRGGSGPNPLWHKCGSGLQKMNSIQDFISCADYLTKEGYVQKDRLAAVGHSAGGLLVGAAINIYPELFRAAILKVPFLDICNTLLDPSLPLTVLDYEEFGNPQKESDFHTIMKYSPYDTVPQGICFPAVLVTSSFHDSRVGVWEAAKWVAKLRESTCSSCSSSMILKTNMSGGHFGEGGRSGQCKELVYEYAFLMKIMGQLDE